MIDSKHLQANIPSSKFLDIPQEFGWALSPALGIVTSGLTVIDRFSSNFSCSDVVMSLSTSDTSNIVYVDIHKNNSSIFDTQVSIDVSGTTSVSATTPFNFRLSASTVTFVKNDEIKFYVSGTTDCTGLKVKLIGNKIINYDEDAQAFLAVTTGLTETQEVAINDLVIGLKNNGTWNKYQAIYPMIGGTEYNHKWNLKDPRDLDLAFRLGFVGGIIHSTNGVKLNGSSGYINPYLNPTLALTYNNTSVSFYSRTELDDGIDISCWNSDNQKLQLYVNSASNFMEADQYNDSTGRVSVTMADSRGYFVSSRVSSSDQRAYKNGSQVGTTQTGASLSFPNTIMNFGVFVGSLFWSAKEYSMFTIGDGLTPTEVANDYTIIQAYQTALNREV